MGAAPMGPRAVGEAQARHRRPPSRRPRSPLPFASPPRPLQAVVDEPERVVHFREVGREVRPSTGARPSHRPAVEANTPSSCRRRWSGLSWAARRDRPRRPRASFRLERKPVQGFLLRPRLRAAQRVEVEEHESPDERRRDRGAPPGRDPRREEIPSEQGGDRDERQPVPVGREEQQDGSGIGQSAGQQQLAPAPRGVGRVSLGRALAPLVGVGPTQSGEERPGERERCDDSEGEGDPGAPDQRSQERRMPRVPVDLVARDPRPAIRSRPPCARQPAPPAARRSGNRTARPGEQRTCRMP